MSGSSSFPVLERAEGIRRSGGDESIFNELTTIFLADVGRLAGLVRTAVEQQSADGLIYAAHTLRGSASQIGATAVAERSRILEKMARAGDLSKSHEQLRLLNEDIQQLTDLLQSGSSAPHQPRSSQS
jgi:HPt (histidine-containing phosphotransfer) domain-containing protein